MKYILGIVTAIAVIAAPALASAPIPYRCRNTNYTTTYVFGNISTMWGLRSLNDLRPDGTDFYPDREKNYRVHRTCTNGWVVQYSDNPNGKILFAPGSSLF